MLEEELLVEELDWELLVDADEEVLTEELVLSLWATTDELLDH